uniref:Uncharacterized protein n=1 Tax=uncultured prokaryote TaxID=198431 RepID=A0A0H5Q2C2_9ZZZZ|nr:hypothetical protein [uncultured prokaryote]
MAKLPYSSKVYLIQGRIGGQQTWSFGLTADQSAVMDQDALMTLAAQALTPAASFWSTLKTLNDSICTFTGVTVRQYSAGDSHATGIGVANTSAVPGTGSSSLAPQTSLVLSTHDGYPGKHHSGRAFLPMTGGVLGGCQLPSSQVDGLLAAAVTLVTALSELPASNTAIGLIVPTSVGSPRRIANVSIDSRPDIIRARGDHLSGIYKKTTAIPPRA